MPRQDARGPLLDAAERLFAQHGIHSVSDRQIAEAASNTNHSAVRYYYGGREGLLRALIARTQSTVDSARRERFSGSTTLLEDVRALVLPVTDAYAALPVPSWRARFLDQTLHDPAIVELLPNGGELVPAATEIWRSIAGHLADLDPEIVQARARLVAHIVSSTCAQIEAQAETSGEPAPWSQTGSFLCDAIAGLLQAPISETWERTT